jgi:hypothetical protein
MYFAFAFPYIMYGIECWSSCMHEVYWQNYYLPEEDYKNLVSLVTSFTLCSICSFGWCNVCFWYEFLMLCVLAFKAFNNMKLFVSISKLISKPLHICSTPASDYNFLLISSYLNICLNSPVLKSIRNWNSLVYDVELSW